MTLRINYRDLSLFFRRVDWHAALKLVNELEKWPGCPIDGVAAERMRRKIKMLGYGRGNAGGVR